MKEFKTQREIAESIVEDGGCSGYGLVCENTCKGDEGTYCPLYCGTFNCDEFKSAVDAAKAYLASLDEEPAEKRPAPKKYEFERDVTYKLNGYPYDPEAKQRYIDSLIEDHSAIKEKLRVARNELRAFNRKYNGGK